jgi:choline dehydrogenase-like flavoprotein
MDKQSTDVVIVGAGASGLAFAWRLASLQPEISIKVIERGDFVDQRNAPSLNNDWEIALLRRFHGNPNIRRGDADYPVEDSDTPIKPSFFNAVGGSTIRWGAHFPRFRPSDFSVKSQDGVARDWPISYQDLENYMDINDEKMGVSGLAGDPGNPCRAERPHPPLGLCEGSSKLARAANRLGWHWWPADAAIISTDRPGGGRQACNNCGPCGMGCPRHARASADIAYLEDVLALGVNVETRSVVSHIQISGGKAHSIDIIDKNGIKKNIVCRELILAGNALSTNVLLQSSEGWNNSKLGKGLMLHPTAIVTGIFAEELHSYTGPFATSLVSQEFYETHPERDFVRGFQLQALRSQGPLSTALGGYGKSVSWGRGHAKIFEQSFAKSMSLTVTCEDLPEDINRIEINSEKRDRFDMPIAKMSYRLSENTKKMIGFGIDRASDWLAKAGAHKINVTKLSEQAGFHLMGTASMGEAGDGCVTGDDGRVHGLENVTIIDASVFVTASPVNPTSTLQALALRAADLMHHRLAQC